MSIRGEQDIVLDCAGAGELGRSKTRQSMKDETDINRILSRYVQTGLLNHVAMKTPVYGDVSQVRDYREAIEEVRAVRDFFVKLPAKIRTRFANDPAAFLDFMSDEANAAEAKELGLTKVEPVPPAVPPVVP